MAYYILKSYKLTVEPFKVFEVLNTQKNCFFLDSSLISGSLGRYSFLGIDPFLIIKTKREDPFRKIREILSSYKMPLNKKGIPFLSGAVGYLAYDLGVLFEKKIKIRPKPDLGIPDCFLGFYNTIIIIDHLKQILHISAAGFPERKHHLARLLAEANLKKFCNLLSKINQGRSFKPSLCAQWPGKRSQLNSNFTEEDYIEAIKKVKEYIRKGDIYQLNLSQQFMAKTSLSGFQIYRHLRKISPSCFSAYLDCQDFQILSSSPESFLRLEGNIVTTRPMKGTRPRGRNRNQDARLKNDLLNSVKDKAELLMIVDLERNDLGKVCIPGSVKVTALRELEKYTRVFQTTATVQGELCQDKDRIDLVRACFPGGSITGCPKIRAMEIIEELEPAQRSIYTGALGYLDFSGNMDFNILIRTILKKDDKLYFGVGGGIVADSKPQEEYQETLVKAAAMMEAIK